jgi:hypothetical protein
MTRKDYIAIGEAVAKVLGRNIAAQEQLVSKEILAGNPRLVSDIGTEICYELVKVFKADNTRFDGVRFVEFFCEKEEGARAEKEASF